MSTSRPGVSDPEQPNHPVEPDVPYQPTEPDEPDVQEPITAQGVDRIAESGSGLKTEYSNGGNETLERNSMHLKLKPEEKTPDAHSPSPARMSNRIAESMATAISKKAMASTRLRRMLPGILPRSPA